MSDIKLVCFDLGRVLVRIADDWRHACEIAGVAWPDVTADPTAPLRLHEIVCASEVGKMDIDEFTQRAGTIFGMSPEHVRKLCDHYLIEPYPGGEELIDELNARGIATACLTNTNANHWRIMLDESERAHLPLRKMTYQFASHLVGHRKPDAGIFEYAERESGLRDEQIAFFDDVLENIDAARARGWRAHQVIHHRPLTTRGGSPPIGADVGPRADVEHDPIAQVRGQLKQWGMLA